MEKQPHQEYRDERAKTLKDLRNSGEREYAKYVHDQDMKWFLNKDGINNNTYKEYRELHLKDIRRKLGLDDNRKAESFEDIEKRIEGIGLTPLIY
jgi:hypothetical protein